MKRLSASAFVSAVSAALAFAALSPSLLAEPAPGGRVPRVVGRPAASAAGQTRSAQVIPSSVSQTGYSVQLNIATRIQGAALYRTAVDITNNTTTDGVTATFQYCYTLSGVYQGCTSAQSILLHNFDNFHQDDLIQYLGTIPGLLPASAVSQSFGTFIVTFDGLPSNNGWEGTVTGRIYNALDEADPLGGVVAIAFQGSLFFESAEGSLVTIARDTTPNPTTAGSLRTNLGVTNTALNNATDSVDFQISFYDPATGSLVGDALIPPHVLAPGEVFQFNDIFNLAHIPSDVESLIVFVDVTSTQGANPLTIEGYVDILDAGTNDGAYFEMKCAAGCPSGAF